MKPDGAPPERRDERMAMLAALVSGDVALAHRLAVDLLSHGVPFDDVVALVLAPVQIDLGRRWAQGDLGVAHEHAASAAVDDLLIRLGATSEEPLGPTIVVATPEHDAHALGARVVASTLSLAGFRVVTLGASVPPADLADYLEAQPPFALALSCSVVDGLLGAARSVAVGHRLQIPVVGGGRALGSIARAARLGFDAFAQSPRDAVEILMGWEISPPVVDGGSAAAGEAAIANGRRHALVAAAIDRNGQGPDDTATLAEELHRLIRIIDSALVVEEPAMVAEHVQWLRETGPAHGVSATVLEDALRSLAEALGVHGPRAGEALTAVLTDTRG